MGDENKVGSIFYDLDIHDNAFNEKASKADKTALGLAQSLKNAEKGSVVFSAAIGAAAIGVTAFGISSVQAYQESENVGAQLDAVLKSTHGAAGLYKEDILDQATALQQLSTNSDEAIVSSANLLLTFTNIKGSVMQDAIATTLDMSQALGQDLKSSSIQLGKALNDPINGITALRRVGVSFTQQQQDQIKTLVESGKTVEAQRMILKELNTEFGGSALAASKTFSGQITIMKNNFDDLQELIGKTIKDGLEPLVEGFNKTFAAMGGASGVMKVVTALMGQFAANLPIIAGFIIGGMTPALYAAGLAFVTMMAPLLPFIAVGTAVGVAVKLLVDAFGGWGNVLKALHPILTLTGNIIGGITKFIVDHGTAVKIAGDIIALIFLPALVKIGIEAAASGLALAAKLTANVLSYTKEIITAAIEGWRFVAVLVAKTAQFVLTAGAYAIYYGAMIVGTVATIAQTAATWLLNGALMVLTSPIFLVVVAIAALIAIGYLVVKNWDLIKSTALTLVNDLVGWFGQLPGRIGNMLSGLVNALTKPFRDAFDSINRMADDTWKKLQKINPLQRNSPSLVDNVQRGMGIIKEEMNSLNFSIPQINQVAAVGGSSSINTRNQYVNVNVGSVGGMQDIDSMNREIGFKLDTTPGA